VAVSVRNLNLWFVHSDSFYWSNSLWSNPMFVAPHCPTTSSESPVLEVEPPLAWWPTIVRTTINWPINSGPPEVQHRTYLVMSIVNSLEFNIVVRGLISEVQCITQCISGPYKWSETSTFCTSARNTLMCKHQPLPDSEGHNVH
jgi:hypothetical protein